MDHRARQAFVKKAREKANRETKFFWLFDVMFDAVVTVAAAAAASLLLTAGTLMLESLFDPSLTLEVVCADSFLVAAAVAVALMFTMMLSVTPFSLFLPIRLSLFGIRYSTTQSYWENIPDFAIRYSPFPCLVLEGNVWQGMVVPYSTARRPAFREAVREYAGADHPLVEKLAALPPWFRQPVYLAAVFFLAFVICGNLWTLTIPESPLGKPRAQIVSPADTR